MSEQYKHTSNRNHKSYKCNDMQKSRRKSKHYRNDSKQETAESKTPPLPARRTSIDELIKKRDSLKEELKKIKKHSDSVLTSKKKSTVPDRIRRQSKSDASNDHTRKRKSPLKEHDISSTPKKKAIEKETRPAPSRDIALAESEDEETIIAKSRERRKQFIESFKLVIDKESQKQNSALKQKDVGSVTNITESGNSSETSMATIKKTADMFADNDDFTPIQKPEHIMQDNSEKNNSQLTDNWDDSEGYYNVRVGDQINEKRYTIKSILGQGVFANVVRAQDNHKKSEVAIKIVRNNDIIFRTGLKEVAILKEIKESDPDDKYHCVQLIRHFMHKNHLCIVLESLFMDMRSIIKKYGKQDGINMKALTSYSRQLLIALRHLKKMGIVHADIKPDNILVNEKKNMLKLCDFGSAAHVDLHEPTPYLVSRFYRAPEIILGVPYKHGIDIWSTACTIYEMATGKIMFMGNSNNRMLKCFMDLKGKFSAKLIRKGKFKDQHFNYNNNFLLHKKDEVTGREKVTEVFNITITRDLYKDLKKHCKNLCDIEEKKLNQLKDMLEKMLTLDLNHRPSVSDCLRHPFIQEELKK